MSSQILERARASHEDIEVYEKAIIQQLEEKPRKNKDRVWQHHRISNLLQKIVERSVELQDIYADEESALKEEVAGMRGRDAFQSFYSKLQQATEYHQRFPDVPVRHQPNVAEESEPAGLVFSGDEVFGKYLDLHPLYIQLHGMPQFEQVDYLTYLSRFHKLEDLPEGHKGSAAYASYVRALLDYLKGFVERTQPLIDAEDVIGAKAEEDFEKQWEAGTVPGWTKTGGGTANGTANKPTPKPIDLSKFFEAKQLEALGLDRLKEGLMALGMKCGGTLQQRAERLFSVKGVPPANIDPKLLAKPSSSSQDKENKGAAQQAGGSSHTRKAVALTEFKVRRLVERLLSDVAEATVSFVEKKATKTVEEREAELREEEEGVLPEMAPADGEEGGAEDDDDDDEEPVYNPKNLPLGYDGKPIPYWLYKLHGLGVEYKCEICGNFTYMGRRAFDRHFQEWRHAHGMRCLKIPNTKHFHDITSIDDAKALYAKIKDQIRSEVYDADAEEEFEDSEGNVLNRRTYEDLTRQGLL